MLTDEQLRVELDRGPNRRSFKPQRPVNGHADDGRFDDVPPPDPDDYGSPGEEPRGGARVVEVPGGFPELPPPPSNPPALAFQIADWNAADRFAGAALPQKWLIGGAIPRGVAGLVAAAGDTGKSYILLEMAIRLAHGPAPGGTAEQPIFGGLVQNYGPVVFITAEDGLAAVHRRMRALDPDGSLTATRQYQLYIVTLPDAGGPFPIVTEERGRIVVTPQFEALRRQIGAIPNPAAVVLDPLQCFVHADINADPRAAAITMSLLNMLAAETGATVLASHHVRKEKEAPKTSQEARHLIRGSSALVDQSRFAIAMWQPEEAEVRKICRLLGADYSPNAIVHGAVVKSNDGASRDRWTLLRGPTGVLADVTHALRVRGGSRDTLMTALVTGIAAAAKAGRPYTKSGVNGLHQRRAELGEELATLGRDRIEALAQELDQTGRIIAALANGTTVKWLDIPDGPFARGQGKFAPGANVGQRGRKPPCR